MCQFSVSEMCLSLVEVVSKTYQISSCPWQTNWSFVAPCPVYTLEGPLACPGFCKNAANRFHEKKKCLRCQLCNLDSGVRVRVSFFLSDTKQYLEYEDIRDVVLAVGSCAGFWDVCVLRLSWHVHKFASSLRPVARGMFVFFACVIAVALWKPVIKGYYFVLVVSSLYIENQFSAIWKKIDSCLKLINEFYWPSFLVFLLFCFNFFFCYRRSFVKTSDK